MELIVSNTVLEAETATCMRLLGVHKISELRPSLVCDCFFPRSLEKQ